MLYESQPNARAYVHMVEGASPERRTFLALSVASLVACFTATARGAAPAPDYPNEVAGIRLPRTATCSQAFRLCRSIAPAFLLNHSLRAFVFGALHAAHHRQAFEAETAFVAAILHDLGLLKVVESANGSFETDGADRAERLLQESGAPATQARAVWNAIVMHDMRFAIPSHQSAEAVLVAAGAAADVVGPDDSMIPDARVREVLAAIPRLDFKRQFVALLQDHCQRKPGAQNGTWLEGFCRLHSVVPPSGTERAIFDAPFPE